MCPLNTPIQCRSASELEVMVSKVTRLLGYMAYIVLIDA